MRNNLSLSPKQARFAEAFARHHNASLACREAGYSAHGRSASVTGTRLLANVCVRARIRELEAAAARELGVSKQRFLSELRAAAQFAMEQRDPMAAISAWREIGRACGYYEPVQTTVKVDTAVTAMETRLTAMSDAELMALLEQHATVIPSATFSSR